MTKIKKGCFKKKFKIVTNLQQNISIKGGGGDGGGCDDGYDGVGRETGGFKYQHTKKTS